MTTHLTPQQIQRILTEEFAVDATTASHLDHCATCQQQLETIAAGSEWWTRTSQFLAMSDPVDRAHSETFLLGVTGHPATDAPEPGDAWTQVLDAPAHPEMLGRLGHYDIESVIGQGGMGIVYKGFDRHLNRPVAIKVLSPHLASNGIARKRFAREARAAAAVVHPHVVPIHGVSSDTRFPFIVMPLVAGRNLQDHVEKQGCLETRDIVRIMLQVAAGLEEANKQGLVHRDIKPANILMEEDVSRVMITDFGLARAADDAAMTQTGWLAGTPHYMSPEQARGGDVGHRSDLFALGGVAYFMATGRVPFRAEKPVAILHRICNDEITPVQQINPDIPLRLARIIEKLLEKRPGDRFADAASLREACEDYLAHLNRPDRRVAPQPVMTRRVLKQRRALCWRWLLGSLAIVVVAVAFVVWPQPAGSPHNEMTPSPTAGHNGIESIARQFDLSPNFEQRLNQLDDDLRQLEHHMFGVPGLSIESGGPPTSAEPTVPDFIREEKQ